MLKKDKTPLYVEIPDRLYLQLKDAAREQDKSMSLIVRESLEVALAGLTIASTPALDGFARFTELWRGKSFADVLDVLGIREKELHAAMAGIKLTEKALQHDAYIYLLQRARESVIINDE